MNEPTRLLVVGRCPVDRGPVVLLRSSLRDGSLVVGFAPCCGLAWRTPAESLRVDAMDSLADLGVSRVAVADIVDLEGSAWRGIRTTTVPLDDVAADIPGLEPHT